MYLFDEKIKYFSVCPRPVMDEHNHEKNLLCVQWEEYKWKKFRYFKYIGEPDQSKNEKTPVADRRRFEQRAVGCFG